MPIQQALPNTRSLPAEKSAPNEAVRKAIAAAREAGTAYESAIAEKNAADAAIVQAQQADDAADRAAVAAGKELTTKSAVPKARDAAELAARRLSAAESHYRVRFGELIATITANRDEWMADVVEHRDLARASMRKALGDFARARAVHTAHLGTIEALEPFVEGFARPWGGFPEERSIERGAGGPDFVRADVLNSLRGSRRFSITADQIDRVLVELEYLGAGEKPWTQPKRDEQHEVAQW